MPPKPPRPFPLLPPQAASALKHILRHPPARPAHPENAAAATGAKGRSAAIRTAAPQCCSIPAAIMKGGLRNDDNTLIQANGLRRGVLMSVFKLHL
jgi:hypothetical protein